MASVDLDLDLRLRELPPGTLHDLLVKIAEIDEFKGWWNGRDRTDATNLARRKTRVVKISAAASAEIDRRDSSRTNAAGHPRAIAHRESEDRDRAHITGYAELLSCVFDHHADMEFSQHVIFQFHVALMKYSATDQRQRGRYKNARDRITPDLRRSIESIALRPADPLVIPREMEAVTEWAATQLASSEFHPLLVIAGFVLEFLAIRPFVEANGRMSRILTTFLLLRCGYAYIPYASLEKVIADRRTEYHLALRRGQVNRYLPRPDIAPWLRAFLDVLRAHTVELRAAIEGRPGAHLLSMNQLGVLELLDRHREVTNRLACHELGISKDTAKQVLNRLLALNMIRRLGSGRAIRYQLRLGSQTGSPTGKLPPAQGNSW